MRPSLPFTPWDCLRQVLTLSGWNEFSIHPQIDPQIMKVAIDLIGGWGFHISTSDLYHLTTT